MLLNRLKTNDRGYQTRINRILRAAMESKPPRHSGSPQQHRRRRKRMIRSSRRQVETALGQATHEAETDNAQTEERQRARLRNAFFSQDDAIKAVRIIGGKIPVEKVECGGHC